MKSLSETLIFLVSNGLNPAKFAKGDHVVISHVSASSLLGRQVIGK